MFKGFLILTEFGKLGNLAGKLGKFVVELDFQKTQMSTYLYCLVRMVYPWLC